MLEIPATRLRTPPWDVWKRLALSFKGMWPTVDWNKRPWADESPVDKEMAGKELADGLFGVLTCLKGDLDYFAKGLGLRHYNSQAMCDFCPANRDMANRSTLY